MREGKETGMLPWDQNAYRAVAASRDRGLQQVCKREHLCGIPGSGTRGGFQCRKDQPDRDIQGGEQAPASAVDIGGAEDMQGAVGHKSKELRSRQSCNTAEVIAYADKAHTRLRGRYYRLLRHGKGKNVAFARELACFVWGMMTDNIRIQAV